MRDNSLTHCCKLYVKVDYAEERKPYILALLNMSVGIPLKYPIQHLWFEQTQTLDWTRAFNSKVLKVSFLTTQPQLFIGLSPHTYNIGSFSVKNTGQQ